MFTGKPKCGLLDNRHYSIMKANVIRLYKHYCNSVENPKGVDSLERTAARKNAERAKADLENHFKTSKKYANDPEIQALLKTDEVVEPKQTKKVAKKEVAVE